MASIEISSYPVVVLCGGRGSRLGMLSDSMPKSMVLVHDKPIIWYIILNLYRHGFREFIFPLGYKGEVIRKYIASELFHTDCKIHFKDSGESTCISSRIDQVSKFIKDGNDFLLVNGDTFFDFNIEEMIELHQSTQSLLTISSIPVKSTYGLIIEDDKGKISGFARDKEVSHFIVNHDDMNSRAYINSGITILNKEALGYIDLSQCDNFEHELFSSIIGSGRASHYRIRGVWFAVDTQKDLNVINSVSDAVDSIGKKVKMAKKNLLERYTYGTKYVKDVNVFLDDIHNKKIIPHQVEIQPGPKSTKELCWLKCPYCYGLSAEDDGSRLSDQRYLEIMNQIAVGGVKKVIFAGYATDPLNYHKISDLLQVAMYNKMVFGFHTKAIKVSERLASQVAASDAAELSYFSVSIDAGTNSTYNKVHGVENSKACIYDKVVSNIKRIDQLRKENSGLLDLSATYLINNINNSKSEIVKSINDLKEAGVDIIRFTFPQAPRHYDVGSFDDFVPTSDEIENSMEELVPIIEEMNSSECQVVIMNLDSEYDTYQKERTLPCYSRFVFPSIGFDGYLSHCSESSAPHFRKMSLGNLMDRDFWDLFYDYSVEDFEQFLSDSGKKMIELGCRCDRKEHVVNQRVSFGG